MTRQPTIVIAAVLLLGASVTADWPQFLGPDRNGSYRGAPIVTTFASGGPAVVWKKKIGQGLSGPVVAGGRVILFHRVGDREVVESLDAASGTTQWQDGSPTTYRDDFGFDEGPRAVPVVADGIVYTFGAEGELRATELASGKRLWSHQTAKEFSVPKGFFGAAGSPLVEGGRVMANIGGAKAGIIAFDARKGTIDWTSTEDAASYSSPFGATIAGQRYAVFLTRSGLVGLDPMKGSVRFQRPWRARANASVNAATPIVVDNFIFVSAEYGPGAAVLRLDGGTLTELWSSDDVLSNHYATSVYAGGMLYGFHGRQEYRSQPSLGRFQDRRGEMVAGQVRRRDGDAGRGSTRRDARDWRARARAGDAGRLQAHGARESVDRNRASLSGPRRRFSLRPR